MCPGCLSSDSGFGSKLLISQNNRLFFEASKEKASQRAIVLGLQQAGWEVFTSRGTGGWCWPQPACICAQPGYCCCSRGSCCHSAPPPCLQSHGSVRNAGSPCSLLPSAPTRPAGGTHSCWDCRLDAVSHTCRQRSAELALLPADWQERRTVRRGFWLQGHLGQRKAVRDDGRWWRLWCHLL